MNGANRVTKQPPIVHEQLTQPRIIVATAAEQNERPNWVPVGEPGAGAAIGRLPAQEDHVPVAEAQGTQGPLQG